MPKPLKFGAQLDLLRRRLYPTYGDLAAKSGVPEKNVARYCTGRGAPSVGHFLRLLTALEIAKPLDMWNPEDFELPEGM